MITCGCNFFEWGTFLRRMENYLMDIYEEPEQVLALNDQLLERHLKNLETHSKYLNGIVDIVRFGDDLGMNNNMFMSLENTVPYSNRIIQRLMSMYINTAA